MSKASKTAMDELHALLATALTGIIRDGVTIMDKEGNAVKVSAPATFFKEAREFLKDNGVEALPEANKGLQNLASSLPFPAPDDEGEGITAH